jgi:hypothetical protein
MHIYNANNHKMLDSNSDIKRQIQRIQVQRNLAKQRHNKKATVQKQRFVEIETIFDTLKAQKHNLIYQEVLEEVMGPFRESEEYKLLEVSHKIEINAKLLELMVQQYRKLTDFMVFEINAMEDERKDIQQRHAAKCTVIMEEMSRFLDCFETEAPLSKSEQRRSSCSGGRGSSFSKAPRRRSSMFSMGSTAPDTDESDSLSVVSDHSISVSSYMSSAVRSTRQDASGHRRAEFDLTGMQTKQPALIPEEERFTVIKL